MKRVPVFLIFFIIIQNSSAQSFINADSLYSFGLGISLHQDTYYMPINLTTNFRVEPEFKVNQYKNGDPLHPREGFDVEVGLGGFLIKGYKQFLFYYGLRGGYIHSDDKDPYNHKIEIRGYYLSPTIGAEFFPIKRFSFGCELHLRYYSRNIEEKTYNKLYKYSSSGTNTKTYFFLRIYIL